MDKIKLREKLNEYSKARDKGKRWLMKQFENNHTLWSESPEKFYYYRAPWTLSVTGEVEAAHDFAKWLRRNMFTYEKGFIGKYKRENDRAYIYRDATLIYGLHMMKQFDLSFHGIKHLLNHQDSQSGGFYVSRQEKGASKDQNIPTSCQCGLSCIITGRLESAKKVGKFFEMLWDKQPDANNKLYYVYNNELEDIVTSFSEGKNDKYIVYKDKPNQRFACGGMAAAFLCRLYLATGKKKFIELAQKYQQFSMTTSEVQFNSLNVCKSGWGASLLYQITEEIRYLEWTYRMGDWFLERQNTEGFWDWKRGYIGRIELTLEFVVHLDTLIGAVTAADNGIE